MYINEKRPLEELVGINLFGVRQILGRIHCMTGVRDQIREIRRKHMKKKMTGQKFRQP